MARPLYSERFIRASLVGVGATASFVVPTGHRCVVVDISATASAAPGGLLVGQGPGGPFFAVLPISATTVQARWTGRQVLYDGETLTVLNYSGNTAVWVSGYLLEDT